MFSQLSARAESCLAESWGQGLVLCGDGLQCVLLLECVLSLAEEQKVEGKKLFFVEADYNILPFDMQMRYNLMTDVLIGPHGAGPTFKTKVFCIVAVK